MTLWERGGRWPGVRRGMVRYPGTASEDILVNGSFETGDTTGWTGTATVVDDGVSGTKAAELAGNSGFTSQLNQAFGASAGERYRAEMWIKLGSGSANPLVSGMDGGFGYVDSETLAPTGAVSNGFAKYVANLTIPVTAVFVYLQVFSLTDGQPIRIDRAQLIRL